MKINIKKRVAAMQIPREKRAEIVELVEDIRYEWLGMTADAVTAYDSKYCIYDQFLDSTEKKTTNNILKYIDGIADTYVDSLLRGCDLILSDNPKIKELDRDEVDYVYLFKGVVELVESRLQYALSTLCDDWEIKSRELDILMQTEFTAEFQEMVRIESEELVKENAVIFWCDDKPYKIIRPLGLCGDMGALDYEAKETYELTAKEEKKATSDIKRGLLKEHVSPTNDIMGRLTKLLDEEEKWEVEKKKVMKGRAKLDKMRA